MWIAWNATHASNCPTTTGNYWTFRNRLSIRGLANGAESGHSATRSAKTNICKADVHSRTRSIGASAETPKNRRKGSASALSAKHPRPQTVTAYGMIAIIKDRLVFFRPTVDTWFLRRRDNL